MGVEIVFPVEFLVSGTPPSHQSARRDALDDWKANVREASRSALPEGHFATDAPVAVTVYYFTDGSETGDLDNIIKPILDAVKAYPVVPGLAGIGGAEKAQLKPMVGSLYLITSKSRFPDEVRGAQFPCLTGGGRRNPPTRHRTPRLGQRDKPYAVSRHIYRDDKQVARLLIQRFEPDDDIQFLKPSSLLTHAQQGDRPILYVRIDDQPLRQVTE